MGLVTLTLNDRPISEALVILEKVIRCGAIVEIHAQGERAFARVYFDDTDHETVECMKQYIPEHELVGGVPIQ